MTIVAAPPELLSDAPIPPSAQQLYYSYLMAKGAFHCMQEVAKIQQTMAKPDTTPQQREQLKTLLPIAYKAYTDPFGAKTYA